MRRFLPLFIFSVLAAVLVGLSSTVYSGSPQPILPGDAQQVLEQWFEIDQRQDIRVNRSSMARDAIGPRFRIEFQADDGQRVNGILAMPDSGIQRPRLALALHPMGSDQAIWWVSGAPLFGGELTQHLRHQGYAVIALDARHHGERSQAGLHARAILDRAHSENPALYNHMIVDSVRDYRQLLLWANAQEDLDTRSVLLLGYSMGAQTSLLLASSEPMVSAVLAMVPPYVDQPHSPVAPRQHVARIENAAVLLMAGEQDPYSSKAQTQHLFEQIESARKELLFFDSGHLLPDNYIEPALVFIDNQVPTNHGTSSEKTEAGRHE